MRRGAFVLCVLGLACRSDPPAETVCPDAGDRLGHRVCVHRISDLDTWTTISFEAAAVDQARATTYLVPVDDDARLAPLFVDASAFEMPTQSLHYRFLTESFPEFATLEYAEYVELIKDPVRREWFAGSLTEFIVVDDDPVWGFTVWDEGSDPNAVISCEQFRDLHRTLSKRVEVGQVAAIPAHELQLGVLEDCDIPFFDPNTALDYEAYNKATGCGTLTRYTLAELATAQADAAFGWQSLLVVEEAPFDIETVISGIVTGTRQGELSHLNVRSAARGTPNCYVRDAYELFADWDDQLVALECRNTEATIVPITPEEAQACWEDLRPEPVDVVPPDLDWTELVGLLELPTDTPEERTTAVARFGSKGSNLGALYQRIDSELRFDGFLIPAHYYDQFVRSTTWSVDLGQGPADTTFQATLEAWLADPEFSTNGSLRRQKLEELRAAMQASTCDPTLLTTIGDEIVATFGADDIMVRFRSSSNAEDAIGFNGAGLYDSTSVCLADETDADALGPSRCDPDKSNERDLCRGLTKVWASLWNMKAFEERDWYGIDHTQVAMGILVNPRTKGELANIVAFSGNPLSASDDRYLVNAQIGELDVVSSLPGVWPEKELLTVEDGAVIEIERERGSTELPEGEWVLDDARLQELGAAFADIADTYPVDADLPPTADVLLDTEWKIRPDGRLVIKQIRPFVR